MRSPAGRRTDAIRPGFITRVNQRRNILRKTGSPKAAAGIQEVAADARIGAETLAHHVDIHLLELGEIRELVHQADPGGQHGVGGIFAEFGFPRTHHDDARAVDSER